MSDIQNQLYEAACRGADLVVGTILKTAAETGNVSRQALRAALSGAIQWKREQAILMLLKYGAFANMNDLLQVACWSGMMELAEYVLSMGAEVESVNVLSQSCLYSAACMGHADMVALLLAHHADPNRRDDIGFTALHHAAQKGFWRVIEILIANGACVDLPGGIVGETALHCAARCGCTEEYDVDPPRDCIRAIKVLVGSGARVQARTSSGWTPLHIAAMEGRVINIACLLDHGAQIEAGDDVGNTPLCAACATGKKEAAEALLTSRAVVNAQNATGFTPFLFAVRTISVIKPFDMALLNMLASYGADARAKDASGETALHLAASHGNSRVVEYLLELGCDPNARNAKGQIPSAVAREQRQETVASLLDQFHR